MNMKIQPVSPDIAFKKLNAVDGLLMKEDVVASQFAAKELTSDQDLSLYFRPRSSTSFCNHAVAVVAATAAVVGAVSSVIAASTRTTNDVKVLDKIDDDISGLNIEQLLSTREKHLDNT